MEIHSGILVAFLLIGLLIFGLWVWSLIHCIRNDKISDSSRIIGVVLIVVLGLIGSLIYLFLPRNKKTEDIVKTEMDAKKFEDVASKVRANSQAVYENKGGTT